MPFLFLLSCLFLVTITILLSFYIRISFFLIVSHLYVGVGVGSKVILFLLWFGRTNVPHDNCMLRGCNSHNPNFWLCNKHLIHSHGIGPQFAYLQLFNQNLVMKKIPHLLLWPKKTFSDSHLQMRVYDILPRMVFLVKTRKFGLFFFSFFSLNG